MTDQQQPVATETERSFTVRPAHEGDAEQLIAFVNRIAEEPRNNILFGPGDFKMTLDEERDFLCKMASTPTSVFLVACEGDRVVGVADAHGGKRPANQHCAMMGISIAKDCRGQGVGTLLMQALVDWARDTGVIKRIELNVFVRNTVAIHLYERFGFVVEGADRMPPSRMASSSTTCLWPGFGIEKLTYLAFWLA